MKAQTLPEMMTLREVAEFFRVDPRTVLKYGVERFGGVRFGSTIRFKRSEVMNYGVQKHEQKQGKVSLDGPAFSEWEERTESFSDPARCVTTGKPRKGGVRNNKRAGRAADPFNVFADMGK